MALVCAHGAALSRSPLVIREVTEHDFLAWKPLWDGYNAFYGRSGATALPDEVILSAWSRFLDPAESMHALVAESDGQLLGLTHYLFHRSTISIANSCYLQDLFTVAQAGASRVYWQTHETNTTAMKLYDHLAEKSGFIVYRKPL